MASPGLIMAEQARRRAAIEAEAIERAHWQAARESSVALAEHVRIRSDNPENPEPVPFELYPYQRRILEWMEQGRNLAILKARQLGISWLFALDDLRAAQGGARIGYWSAGEREAREQTDERVLAMWRSLPAPLQERLHTAYPRLSWPDTGGSFTYYPATAVGGIGSTFDRVRMDEFAFHEYGRQNWAAVSPTIGGGGHAAIWSTSDPSRGPSGAFFDLFTEAVAGREWQVDDTGIWYIEPLTPRSFSPIFLPWHIRPGRDAAWLEEERRRMGASDDAAFRAFYPSAPDEAFTGREGLVYPEFSPARHVTRAPIPWEACTYRIVGYDLGGGDPTAFVPLGAWPDVESGRWRIHQYAEWYERRGVGVNDAHAILSAWASPDFVEGDPREPSLIASLQTTCRYGHEYDCPDSSRHGWPVELANWRRGEGLDIVREWLTAGALTIDPSCTNSIKEFAQYRWAERRNPADKATYATRTAVDDHADAMDARRYAMARLHYLIANSGAGGRGSRKASY